MVIDRLPILLVVKDHLLLLKWMKILPILLLLMLIIFFPTLTTSLSDSDSLPDIQVTRGSREPPSTPAESVKPSLAVETPIVLGEELDEVKVRSSAVHYACKGCLLIL